MLYNLFHFRTGSWNFASSVPMHIRKMLLLALLTVGLPTVSSKYLLIQLTDVMKEDTDPIGTYTNR